MTTTTYFASRDTANDRADDETRAMCHASIYRGESLEDAQRALGEYMQKEVDYLIQHYSQSERAAQIAGAIQDAVELDPEPGKPYNAALVEVAGLIFKLVRIEKEVA